MMRVNEIFHSLQGEGYNSGTPAVFIRFSGCNLQCPFCDTQHESGTEMTEQEVVEAVKYLAPRSSLVVITGGEPALQLTASLVDALHEIGKRVAVETNGTLPLPPNVDWITLSPKNAWLGDEAVPVLTRADELKVLYDGSHDPSAFDSIAATHRFLQPMDTGDANRNADLMQQAADYCLQHPQWRLSLQIHKILNIR
ncbi:MAG: radical SAM protein [Prevotella sp.]|nr:radical SAM protein [Prevotella sp.]